MTYKWNTLPKRATILLWILLKDTFRGIKESVLNRYEDAIFARAFQKSISTQNLESSSVVSTIGMLKNMDVSYLITKLRKDLELHNLDGLARELGITKEGVRRLIWSLGAVLGTKNGSEIYSSETILLVKNALQKERILKQTITLLDFQPLLTKKILVPMNKQWRVNGYGIKVMDAPCVVNAIAI